MVLKNALKLLGALRHALLIFKLQLASEQPQIAPTTWSETTAPGPKRRPLVRNDSPWSETTAPGPKRRPLVPKEHVDGSKQTEIFHACGAMAVYGA